MNISPFLRIINHKPLSSHRLDLIWHLVKRDFILQYKRSVLGIFWSLLLPLGQLLVLVFVFQLVIPLKIDAYPLFLFTGLLPWSWFSDCLNSSGILFTGNGDLIRKPNFEPLILVIVNTVSKLLLFLVALPLIFILMIFYAKTFTISLIFLPVLILIQGLLIIGLSLIIATFNSFYSDIQHIVGVAVMMLFFLTPIFYGYESVAESHRILYLLNPMANLIQNFRLILLNGTAPNMASMFLAIIASATLYVIGYISYSRHIHKVIDIIN